MALVQSPAPVPPLARSRKASRPSKSRSDPFSISASIPASAEILTGLESTTSRGHDRPMSFQMSSSFGAPPNPYQIPANYAPANGTQTPHVSHTSGKDILDIYMAVYSGISVYEMMVNGVNVMRRRNDSWLNATQILKVAGIEKGKRTKVLEKEILPGKHEKVQGGYGKYQGTWIEYERGRDFCRQYGVEELLRPLLEYDMDPNGQSKGTLDTPTKEQAMAAQRKKKLSESRVGVQSPNGTFFKNISTSAANAVQAINRARFESPGSRPGSSQKPTASLRRSLSHQKSGQDFFQPSSQQSMHSMHSEPNYGAGQYESSFNGNLNPYLSQPKRPQSSLAGGSEPPRKRMRSDSSPMSLARGASNLSEATISIPAHAASGMRGTHTDALGVPPLPSPSTTLATKKQSSLLSLVLTDEDEDIANHPAFEEISGSDLDIPMDASGHTALIWAATLARLGLVRKLVIGGANIFRVNVGGETALMRAASAVNNSERGTFPELLEILGPTIEMRDGRGRTVLHHIAIASAIKGRSRACKYYLESLLEFVVRQGSGLNSMGSSTNQDSNETFSNGNSSKQKAIGLARFMSEIVNAQDMSGDTALNMAARNGNHALAQQLLEVGADVSIANNGGLKPTDFGVESISGDSSLLAVDGAQVPNSNPDSSAGAMGPPPTKKVGSKVTESGTEVLNMLKSIVEDAQAGYTAEARAKQALIDEARVKLKAARERLQVEQTRRNELRRRKEARHDLQTQIANLRRCNNETRQEIIKVTRAQPKPSSQVKIGDADAGLWIDPSLLPAMPNAMHKHADTKSDAMDTSDEHGNTSEVAQPIDLNSLTPEQKRYITGTLSQSHFLRARLAAYSDNNEHLEQEIAALAQKSSALQSQVKKILSIGVGVPEDRIDPMLPGLITAIESEQGEVDMGRVREFLRRVEEDEAPSERE